MATTKIKTHADFQKYNFFRTPDWRWQRVLELVDREDDTPGRCTRRDDNFVRLARNFVLRWRNTTDKEAHEKMLFENPGLCYAYDFHQKATDDPENAMFIQARLLARQSPDQIADVMGMMPEAIQWYADLFFDVVPYLDKRDWITKRILLPALIRTAKTNEENNALPQYRDNTLMKPFLDGSLKMFAYFGGTHLVDILLANMNPGKPLVSSDDTDNWFDANWGTTIRKRSAQASHLMEINKYNVMELFQVHAQIMQIARSDDSQEHNKTNQERHVEAMLSDIPWVVGDDAEKLYSKSVVGRFDNMSAELRDDELLLITSGRTVPTLTDNFPKELPAPRKNKKAHSTSGEVTLP